MTIDLDGTGLALLVLSIVAAVLLVPDMSAALVAQPAFHGILAASAVTTVVVVLRGRGIRGSTLERRLFGVFLGLMPTVYILSALRRGDVSGWLAVELAGQVVFAAIAVLGVRRWPWMLAGGIAAHGLLWDAWHHGRSSAFMPDWYTVACAIIDVGWAVYVAAQVGAWRAAMGSERPRGG